jgi:hypothetical protein
VQVGDIDFPGRTLKLASQLQRANPADIATGKNLVKAVGGITVMVRAPKYESERTIHPPDELVAILAEHLRQHTPEGRPPGGCSTRATSRGTTTSSTTAGPQPVRTRASDTSCTTSGTTSPAD